MELVSLSGESYYRDPYPVYARMRDTGSIHPVRFPAIHAWLVTGYEAAVRALNDDRLGKNHSRANANWHAKASIMPEPQHSQLQVHLLHQDPPRHTAMRELVAGAFTARRSEAWRDQVRDHVADLIHTLPPSGPVDLIEAYAAKLPLLALADAIGLPDELAQRFDPAWGGVVAPVGPDDPRRARYEALLAGLQLYIGDVVAAFTGGGGNRDTLLARLVAAHEAGELSRAELDSIVFQLLAAGQDPVTNQIGMSMLALLRNPEALQWLREHPDRIERAVEELLRFESAFSLTTWRFFTEDTRWDGVVVPAGDSVIVALGAANRDPARFGCPERLDLGRTPNPHLAFGHGIHFCPGAPLARIQLQESLTALLRRLPGIRLAGAESELRFQHAALARGLVGLPVTYEQVLP